MRLDDLGLIGNCQYAALVHRDGAVVWCCLPRFDSEPIFGSLLDEDGGGRFQVGPASGAPGVQRYIPNTNVLETVFDDGTDAFRLVDFAPRFEQHERSFRPTQLFRVLEPLRGQPRVRVVCDPRLGWSRQRPQVLQGSNHLRYEGFDAPLRLTTDVPLSYLATGQTFALTGRRHLALSWGQPIEEPLQPLTDRFLGETLRYWRRWVKGCAVPVLYQDAVIRSALALKLHCFEDTGAIVAATTTSLPEAPGSGRTWDYRYCWLRDAYYVLGAFHLLGQFEERERFIQWLFDVAGGSPDLDLAPLYRVDGRTDLEERLVPGWPGFGGHGPVRVGNGAALQRQNDIFGETALALSPVFLDERFQDEQSPATLALLTRLARKAVAVAGTPDAGIWEVRAPVHARTFSSLMSWAAADRVAVVLSARKSDGAAEFAAGAARIRDDILHQAWNGTTGAFAATYGGADLDASLLQMAPLRFLPADDPRLGATVDAVTRGLGRDGWVWRYADDDGLGTPQVAFVLCTLWLVEALAFLGRGAEARRTLELALAARNPLGLLSEDFDPRSGERWGNFPQAYSHVGLIRAAFAASPAWGDVL
jgi:GH15 family glucan-1,4-alpha-glucosidase